MIDVTSEDDMAPRKPTIEDLDDVDDEDGVLEEQRMEETDLDLTLHTEDEAGLGGIPDDLDQEEER
jgi:hypothetical protein